MKQRTVVTKITGLSRKGNGIGEFEREDDTSWPVEVPFAIPGDEVKALIFRKRRGAYQSRMEELIHPSPERISPRCVHFGTCGGCRWQQMDYEKQGELKEKFVRHCLAPGLASDVHFHPILLCEKPWEYRNKMEFSFSMDKEKTPYLGMIMEGGKGRVFNLTECHLVNPWFAKVVTTVRQWWLESGLEAFRPYRNTGSLRTLIVREGIRTGDKMVMLTVSGNPDFALNQQQIDGFVAHVRDAIEPLDPAGNLSIFLRIQQQIKGKPTQFYEMHLSGPDHIQEVLHVSNPMTFKVSPTAFFQPNSLQAEKLYSRGLELTEIPENAVVYDLYCGTGTLGICAAQYAKQVVGIELSPEAVLDARENAELNGVKHYEVMQGNVQEVLQKIQKESLFPSPDIVMVDPPRVGLDPDAIKQIIQLSPEKILYISCNPVTQAKNCEDFLKHGYRIVAVQPIDQFPQTVHIENIVVLIRE